MGIDLQDPPVADSDSISSSAHSARKSVPRNLLARCLGAAFLALAVLAGTASLTGVVEGTSWLPYLILPIVAMHVVYGLLRGIHPIRWLALPAAAVVVLVAIIGHEAMKSNDYGISDTQWFFASLSEAGLQLASQVPPVGSSTFVDLSILVLTLAVSLISLILSTFRRTALLVIIPLSFAPIIASLFKQEGAGIGYIALLMIGLLGYVATLPYSFAPAPEATDAPRSARIRSLRVLGITALACVASLLAASAWMPGFRTGMFPEGERPSGELLADNVDPLINLGRDLRSNGKKPFLTYYTSSEKAPYLRTQVIKNLNGQRWEPDDNLFYSDYFGDTAVTSDFSSFGNSEEVLRMTWPEANTNPLLPLPNQSYFVQGIQGDWRWTHETSVAKLSGDAMTATKDITVAYEELQVDSDLIEQLASWDMGAGSPVSSEYSQLPPSDDNALQSLLQKTLIEAYSDEPAPRTDLGKAAAIQHFFRSGKFMYSERTPLREGYDGANAQVVQAFLDRRQGYCVHFASAMALLAREAGIPSRIAVGYAPGVATGESIEIEDSGVPEQFSRTNRPNTTLKGYTVSGQQAHAWPELHIEGIGWVPFEPTPGRGYTPSYAPEATQSAAPVQSTAPEVPTSRTTESRSKSADPTTAATAPQTARQDSSIWWIVPVVVILAAGLLFVGPWRRNRHRQQRLSLIRSGGEEAAGALWDELLSIGSDAKIPAGAQQSVGDYAGRLATDHPSIASELQEIQRVVELSFYAHRHPETTDSSRLLDGLHVIENHLRLQLSVWQRMATFLAPPSLKAGLGRQKQPRRARQDTH